jgi:hypothetical protein
MTDCQKLISQINELHTDSAELEQRIGKYLSINNSETAREEKTKSLWDIYESRKVIREKIKSFYDRLKVYTFLESLPEGRVERISIRRGNFGSSDELVRVVEQDGNVIPAHVKFLLSKCDIKLLEKEVVDDLVIIELGDLGFNNYEGTVENIFKRAEEIGLKLCNPEVGPQLLLQSNINGYNDVKYIAMKPIFTSTWNILSVERLQNEPALYSCNGEAEYHYNSVCRFVFRIP